MDSPRTLAWRSATRTTPSPFKPTTLTELPYIANLKGGLAKSPKADQIFGGNGAAEFKETSAKQEARIQKLQTLAVERHSLVHKSPESEVQFRRDLRSGLDEQSTMKAREESRKKQEHIQSGLETLERDRAARDSAAARDAARREQSRRIAQENLRAAELKKQAQHESRHQPAVDMNSFLSRFEKDHR